MIQDDHPARYRYRAFISHRHHKQPAFVRRLELALKQYAKPLFRPPMRIFRDENHLSPGVDLPQLIKSALDESEFLILLASPEAAASIWVREELRHWCETLLRTDRLLIVVVDGIVAADDSQHMDWDRTTALPAMLRRFLASVPFYVDLRWATHDTAIDTSHADFKKAINLLVARLRRVDPIELSGIEVLQHRRNVRLRNGAAAVLVTLLVLSIGTAWFALGQWRSAEARRQEAVIVAAGAELDQGEVLSAIQRTTGDSALPLTFRRNIALAAYDLGALYENPSVPDHQDDSKNADLDDDQEDKDLDVNELYLAQEGKKLIAQGWYNGVHILDLASGQLTRCPGISTRFTKVSVLPGARPYFLLSNDEGLQIRSLEDCQEPFGIEGVITSSAGVDSDRLFIAAFSGVEVLSQEPRGSDSHSVVSLFRAPSSSEIVGIAPTPRGEFTAVLLSNQVLGLAQAVVGRPA